VTVVNVLVPADLDAAQQDDLRALLDRRGAADGHPALPEPLRAAVAAGSGATAPTAVLSYAGPTLIGSALLSADHDGATSLYLIIDPAADDDDLRDALLSRALREAGTSGPLRLWAMCAGPADDTAAARHGFAPERDVIQMRVALPLPADIVAGARPVATRPFDPTRDAAAWLDVNNRAFAGHPEQGAWTPDQLAARLQADWVDLNGFLMADDPDGGLIGSCWTKVHRGVTPVLGEIYIISVDPDRHSQGWGKALTVAGLVWLAGQGVELGMLYTDAENTAAVALYRSLGFSIDHADRAYLLRSPTVS
jgi:mycothiol synthase